MNRNLSLPGLFIVGAGSVLFAEYFDQRWGGYLKIGFSIVLVLRGRLDCLPALFMLYIAPGEFGSNLYAEAETEAAPPVGEVVRVLDNRLVVNLLAPARFLWEFVANNRQLMGVKLPTIFAPWIVGLPFALVSTYLGRLAGNEMWTRSVRFALMIGCFFYGTMLADGIRNWGRDSVKPALQFVLVCASVLVILGAGGFYGGHLGFLNVGLAVGFGIWLLSKRGDFLEKLQAMAIMTAGAWLAIKGTFTLKGIFIVAIVFSILRQTGLATRKLVVTVGILLIAMAVLTTGLLCLLGDQLAVDSGIVNDVNKSFFERVWVKAYADRLPLWRTAYEQIIKGPYLLVPGGRPLLTYSTTHGAGATGEWVFGAHNTALEVLRQSGLLSGGITLAVYLTLLFQLLYVIMRVNSDVAAAVAIGVFSTALIGGFTGDFPLDMNVGFPLWTLAGVVWGYQRGELYAAWKREKAGKAIPVSALTENSNVEVVDL